MQTRTVEVMGQGYGLSPGCQEELKRFLGMEGHK